MLTLTLLIVTTTESRIPRISLRFLAQQQGIWIGAAVSAQPLKNDAHYQEVLAREFNILTPENAMKFKTVHPERLRYDFTKADAIISFAKTHNMQVRGHTLVWYKSNPDWLNKSNFTREQLLDILQEHIYTVVSHFRGKLVSWDVVNEAITPEGKMGGSLWQKVIGSEYIELAFRWAHEKDPQAGLFYNDVSGEGLGQKSDAIYNLVKDLRQRGVPLDGVGFQMHLNLKSPPKPQDVAKNIERLAELGLEVHITEMDVEINTGIGTRKERLAAQASIYSQMLQVCQEAPNCKAFVLWGFTDRHTWLRQSPDDPEAPLIFDQFYRPKPAYKALIKTLQQNN
ncbi:MAG: endo-1,4-beta-xylanase [Symploca sp. SIO2E9]|nr:endo-1,4-beta-xylanase [Symploca sp. SIO2E9]